MSQNEQSIIKDLFKEYIKGKGIFFNEVKEVKIMVYYPDDHVLGRIIDLFEAENDVESLLKIGIEEYHLWCEGKGIIPGKIGPKEAYLAAEDNYLWMEFKKEV